MNPLSPHRPRAPSVGRNDRVRTSDIVLAVTGVVMLGGLCLAIAGHLLGF